MKLLRAFLFCTFGCLSVLFASCASLLSARSSIAQGADPFFASDPFAVVTPFVEPAVKPLIVIEPTYEEQRARCIAESMTLIVGVRCDPPSGAWLTAKVGATDAWPKGEYLAVIRPKAGEAFLVGTLAKDTPQGDISTKALRRAGCSCGECLCFPCTGDCQDSKPKLKTAQPIMLQPRFFSGGGGGC